MEKKGEGAEGGKEIMVTVVLSGEGREGGKGGEVGEGGEVEFLLFLPLLCFCFADVSPLFSLTTTATVSSTPSSLIKPMLLFPFLDLLFYWNIN